jgi:hypothetical protein
MDTRPHGMEPVDRDEPLATSPMGCLARIGWMAAGHAVALIVAVTILREPSWTLSPRDAIFWLVVTSIVTLRWVDVTRLGGLTAAGRPATVRDVVRYAVGVVGAWALVWTIAQSTQLGT